MNYVNVVLLNLFSHTLALRYATDERHHLLQSTDLKYPIYSRQGRAVTHCDQAHPAPLSDLACQVIKGHYRFDLMGLNPEFLDRDMERVAAQPYS